MTPKLSLLIPTIPARKQTFFSTLTDFVEEQAKGKPVEILGLYDNQVRSVGAKRNALLTLAAGEWLAFIDDDDGIAPTYVDALLTAIAAVDLAEEDQLPWDAHCKVIVFDQTVTINGSAPKLCKYGVEYAYTETEKLWTGKPAHTQCWRTRYAKRFQFPEKDFGEDMAWVTQACATLPPRAQHRIEGPPLYRYHYRRVVTATRDDQTKL
jgi:hypothetical protein